MKLDEILFPTDFSSASDVAGRIARDMAKEAGARLHVLHVVPPVTDPSLAAEALARVAQSFGDAAPPAALAAVAAPRPRLVCGRPSDDLISEGCRTRTEVLDQKRESERPARRGSAV